MIPQIVILEAPPELAYMDEILGRYGRARELERMLERIVDTLRYRDTAPDSLAEYVDHFRTLDYELGDMLYRPIQVMGDDFFEQLIKSGIYLPTGDLPYGYEGRGAYDYVILGARNEYTFRSR